MHYHISSPQPDSRFIEVVLTIDNINDDSIVLHLPSWRPGRYELGNFAKNIQQWVAFDSQDNHLPFHKTNKDTWHIETKDVSKIIVKYNYYSAQPDAGGCWTDKELLYLNPVHFCFYVDDRLHLPCMLQLNISANWQVATGLLNKGNNLFQAADFHELVDCPVMASPKLQHHSYEVNDINFNVWISGECKPDWERLLKDFKAFTITQMEMMKTFPANEYHFLLLILPFKFYHGVEHTNSTVLALGPGYRLMEEELYNDLIGVASHELFHAWNIKTIRPVQMLPYYYSKENYSSLGWVYEGFTTYYGDLFLARCGSFNLQQYLIELNARLQKHMDNYGRFNLSVAESSFDTWLDGYVAGIPNRKTSIYDEGSLIALMLDLFIRKNSSGKNSLDNVMLALYNDFALQNRGYREQDIQSLVENLGGADAEEIFELYINGRNSYNFLLQELLTDVGCYISSKPSPKSSERYFGFRTFVEGTVTKILQIAPSSPAEMAGLNKDDEVICVNNIKVENNLQDLINYFEGKEITLEVFTQKQKRVLQIQSGNHEYYPGYFLSLINDATDVQKRNFKEWCGLEHIV